MTLNILVVDDQAILLDGLVTIINMENDMNVVATAENGLQAYELVKELRPHMVLMDIRMPVMNGIEATKKMKADFPETIILILSTFSDEEDIVESLAYGATGFLLKDIRRDKLITTIRDAANGQFMLPSSIAIKLAAKLYQYSSGLINDMQTKKIDRKSIDFTEREIEIIHLLLKGWNNREIASTLFISEGTTRNYMSSIYAKLGTSDRAKALVLLKELFNRDETEN